MSYSMQYVNRDDNFTFLYKKAESNALFSLFFLKLAQNGSKVFLTSYKRKFESLGKNKANKAFALFALLYIKHNRNCFILLFIILSYAF